MSGVLHQAAAGAVFGDFRNRAAHVDVDNVGAHAFHDPGGRGHLVGIAAENLNRHGPLFLGVLRVSSVLSMPRTRPSDDTISLTTRPQPP